MVNIEAFKAILVALALPMAMSCSSEQGDINQGANQSEERELLQEEYTFETQAIGITTARNARQLGGYEGEGGRKVKDDLLIRSGALAWMNDEDAETLEDIYDIKYIVDFRTDEERSDDPDKRVSGAKKVHLPVYGGGIYSEETLEKLEEINNLSGTERDLAYAEAGVITEKYENILLTDSAREAYSKLFDVLLDAGDDEPVLWHCSKGKDRAGLASALVLYALGADDETVARDYLISNEAYADDIAEAQKIAEEKGLDKDTTTEFITSAAGVDRKYIDLAVQSVEREYGSMHNYLNEGLGVSDEEIKELQDKYLE